MANEIKRELPWWEQRDIAKADRAALALKAESRAWWDKAVAGMQRSDIGPKARLRFRDYCARKAQACMFKAWDAENAAIAKGRAA